MHAAYKMAGSFFPLVVIHVQQNISRNPASDIRSLYTFLYPLFQQLPVYRLCMRCILYKLRRGLAARLPHIYRYNRPITCKYKSQKHWGSSIIILTFQRNGPHPTKFLAGQRLPYPLAYTMFRRQVSRFIVGYSEMFAESRHLTAPDAENKYSTYYGPGRWRIW